MSFKDFQEAGVRLSDAQLVQPVGDFALEVAQGRVPGHSLVAKFGHVPAVAANVQSSIWDYNDGLYVWPTVGSILTLSSTDARDTALGQGARTVKITGIDDATRNEISETVILNGLTPVSTVNTYYRLYRMQVLTAGDLEMNLGQLYAGTGTVTLGEPANVWSQITYDAIYGVGENQTLQANYTVPMDKTGYLTRLYYSGTTTNNKEIEVWLYARPVGGVFNVKYRSMLQAGLIDVPLVSPVRVAGGTDVDMRAAASSTTDVAAGFDMILVDN